MELDKSQILDLLRQQGDEGTAQQAERELPDRVDTDQDGGLLQRLGINVEDLIRGAGGAAPTEQAGDDRAGGAGRLGDPPGFAPR